MARMQEEGYPLQELTNRTPSPRDCKNSAAARAHSPWTAARVKKKGRAASDCILADLTPGSSDKSSHGRPPGPSWGQQAPTSHGSVPPLQGLLHDVPSAATPQWVPGCSSAADPLEAKAGCRSPAGPTQQQQQQQQQRCVQQSTAARRKQRLSGGPRTCASSTAVSSTAGQVSSSTLGRSSLAWPGQGLRIQVLPDDLATSTSSHNQPQDGSSAACPAAINVSAAAAGAACSDPDTGSSSPAADMCSPPACLAPPAGCSLAVALQQLELHSNAGHSSISNGGGGSCHNDTTTPTAQEQQQQHHAYVAHLLGEEHVGASGDVELLQEQMDKAAEEGDVGEAQQVWGAMCAAGARPSHAFLHSLLRCWQRGGGDPQDAQRLVQQVCAAGGLEVDRTAARLLEAIDMTWQQLAGEGQ